MTRRIPSAPPSRRRILAAIGLGLAGAALANRGEAQDNLPDALESPRIRRHDIDQPQITIVSAMGHYPLFVDIVTDRENSDSTLRGQRLLPPDEGVLYVVTMVRPISLSNAGVPFATDILFIMADGRIVEIHPAVMPNSGEVFTSNIPVKAALQARAGLVMRRNIGPGDYVLDKLFHRTV